MSFEDITSYIYCVDTVQNAQFTFVDKYKCQIDWYATATSQQLQTVRISASKRRFIGLGWGFEEH